MELVNSYALLLLSYLIGSVTFIAGLKMLSHPETARRGNLMAAAGMTIAIAATIFLWETPDTHQRLHNYAWIFGGLLVGGIVGTLAAKKVKMTSMPEMVSLFNGMGGACAMLISLVEYHKAEVSSTGRLLVIVLGMVIGTVSFAGSMIAWGKLNGRIKDKTIPAGQVINFALLIGIIALAIIVIGQYIDMPVLIYCILAMAAIYGILFVMPIGGADMPVVISLLNSFTGV
ncbi:MAG: NAD(P)(+) transhydrogenase (Re/Si-specific) subunit beta, partial [Flavipsychrobacter sp.]